MRVCVCVCARNMRINEINNKKNRIFSYFFMEAQRRCYVIGVGLGKLWPWYSISRTRPNCVTERHCTHSSHTHTHTSSEQPSQREADTNSFSSDFFPIRFFPVQFTLGIEHSHIFPIRMDFLASLFSFLFVYWLEKGHGSLLFRNNISRKQIRTTHSTV